MIFSVAKMDIFNFSPKDPLRCNSPVAMETNIETADPLGVNAPMRPEGELFSTYTTNP